MFDGCDSDGRSGCYYLSRSMIKARESGRGSGSYALLNAVLRYDIVSRSVRRFLSSITALIREDLVPKQKWRVSVNVGKPPTKSRACGRESGKNNVRPA